MQQMLYRPEPSPTHSCKAIHAPRQQQDVAVREKILAEVVDLERKLQDLKSQAGANRALEQSYKEMIASRRAYYNELNKH